MSNDSLALCFGVHDHQPIGNFDAVVGDATVRAYRPFLETVRRRPELRLAFHASGSLLEWLRERASETFDLLGEVVARGQVELLTGGFYEPILAILPDADKLGQVARLTGFLKEHFGVRPRGLWLAERVWEPHLPQVLRQAGVEYVLVDDSHFVLAGLDPEALGGYYLTEEQGAVLAVFPIRQRLRYLIPFASVEESLADLAGRRGRVPAVSVVDDGEKFGAWPGTHEHVYRDGWLDRFFDRVQEAPWLTMTTFAEVLDRWPATGRVYLPAASYREMGEWALSPSAGRDLLRAKRELSRLDDGERLAGLLRGGFWRSFLTKYPEVGDTYWKMLRLSAALRQELARRPDDRRLHHAREALWRGQANDAYWHGVFGGCYLPHLRRAVKGSLLECERRLAEVTGVPLDWRRGDANGDGREEVLVRTRALSVTLNPERGGTITELGWLPRGLDLADVLTRRPELYHDRIRDGGGEGAAAIDAGGATPGAMEAGLTRHLGYDDLRRASLADGWFEAEGGLDPVAPWPGATTVVGRMRLGASVAEESGGVEITMAVPPGAGLGVVEKRVTVRDGTVEARYRVRAVDGGRLRGQWAVQWNLALTAGSAPDRYLDLAGRPLLASAGRREGATAVTLVDEWAGVEAHLAWRPEAELAWGPVETISVSESGLERIYQGLALLIAWPLGGTGETEVVTSLTVRDR